MSGASGYAVGKLLAHMNVDFIRETSADFIKFIKDLKIVSINLKYRHILLKIIPHLQLIIRILLAILSGSSFGFIIAALDFIEIHKKQIWIYNYL
jgi:hypothetical protein